MGDQFIFSASKENSLHVEVTLLILNLFKWIFFRQKKSPHQKTERAKGKPMKAVKLNLIIDKQGLF